MTILAAILSCAILFTSSCTVAFIAPRPTITTSTTTTALDATIAVFGASGLTAQECIYQALRDGDTVVGLTRNPSKCVVPKGSGGKYADGPMTSLTNPNLTLIAGDVTNPADVAKGKCTSVIICIVYCQCVFKNIYSTILNENTPNNNSSYTQYLTNTVFESNIDGVIVALGGKTSDVGDTMLTGKVANIVY
jgi:hypothetical protein